EPSMPGMLTAEELAPLEQAQGVEFERLLLELMIRHHEGALVIVGELFAAPGAGPDPAVIRLATDVDAGQRAEIRRMQAMLEGGGPGVAGHRPRRALFAPRARLTFDQETLRR